jgi:hypothetical protein
MSEQNRSFAHRWFDDSHWPSNMSPHVIGSLHWPKPRSFLVEFGSGHISAFAD